MANEPAEILLRKIRKAENLTQEGLAERMGYTRTAISHIERGAREISKGMMSDLRRVFPRYFMEEGTEPEEQPRRNPEPIRLWPPEAVEFALRVLNGSGWMQRHDAELREERRSTTQRTVAPESWTYMSEKQPEQPGRYYVAGYKRNGLPYEGVALLYADGCWYTLRGNRMPTPDKWQPMRHYTETVRY